MLIGDAWQGLFPAWSWVSQGVNKYMLTYKEHLNLSDAVSVKYNVWFSSFSYNKKKFLTLRKKKKELTGD